MLPLLARWRCNAVMAAACSLPSDMWRSRPSRIAADMKAEAMAFALSRALLGGRHAQSMWVKAEQSNLCATSVGCARAEVVAASTDSAAVITRFIITSPCVRNPTNQRIYDEIVQPRVPFSTGLLFAHRNSPMRVRDVRLCSAGRTACERGRIEKGARISDQCFPVLGLRPADATVLDRKSPEAAQFNAIFPGERCHDLTQNGVDDILYIALVEVGILRCKHSRGRSL
jgi:hypothetical protein